MITRRRSLIVLLAGLLGIWLTLQGIARLYREEANYSLIEEGLYMGGYVFEPPPNAEAVLNLCETSDPYEAVSHRWEPIRDAEPAPSLEWLRRMVEFVDTQRSKGTTVFVHCQAGVSRSGMVVTAYVMFKLHWTRDKALAYVRSKRPQTRPNPAFMQRLLDWEAALNGHVPREEPHTKDPNRFGK